MAVAQVPGSGDDEEESLGFTEPNIVPLVDIMLVLLVILMAGSSAIVPTGGGGEAPGTGFRVNLPSASGDQSVDSVTNELVLTVLANGDIVLGEDVLDLPSLEARLREVAEADASRMLLVQADESAVHARVVEAMEVARRAGLSNLAIATRGGEPDE